VTDYPRRGDGEKHIKCELYGTCLDIAAAENWSSFNCEGCPELQEFKGKQTKGLLGRESFPIGQQKEAPVQDKKPALCEECKTRPILSPGGRLCASCMAKRSHKPKGEAPKEKAKKTPPKQPPRTGVAEPVITIHFDGYGEILTEIERLAEEETRTLELQVIHLLKEQLHAVQKSLGRGSLK